MSGLLLGVQEVSDRLESSANTTLRRDHVDKLSFEVGHRVLQAKTINLLLGSGANGVLHEVKVGAVSLLLNLLMINSDVNIAISVQVLWNVDQGLKEESLVKHLPFAFSLGAQRILGAPHWSHQRVLKQNMALVLNDTKGFARLGFGEVSISGIVANVTIINQLNFIDVTEANTQELRASSMEDSPCHTS